MSFRAYSKTTDRKDEFAVLTGIVVLLIFSNFLVTEFFQFTSTHVLGCCNMLQ